MLVHQRVHWFTVSESNSGISHCVGLPLGLGKISESNGGKHHLQVSEKLKALLPRKSWHGMVVPWYPPKKCRGWRLGALWTWRMAIGYKGNCQLVDDYLLKMVIVHFQVRVPEVLSAWGKTTKIVSHNVEESYLCKNRAHEKPAWWNCHRNLAIPLSDQKHDMLQSRNRNLNPGLITSQFHNYF